MCGQFNYTYGSELESNNYLLDIPGMPILQQLQTELHFLKSVYID